LLAKSNHIGWVCLFGLVLLSCGYRFSGSGAYPLNVQLIFVEVFENRTSKTGVERIVTNQLMTEFTRQRESSLAGSPEEADAILKGVINRVSTRTISYVGYELANEREVTVTIDVKLSKKSGEIIWSAKGLSDIQAFDVSDSKIQDDRNEDTAIARISERLSVRVFNRLTDNF
jgi:outer membrane lipopolysaccharide assembly protein LptE/RlpB